MQQAVHLKPRPHVVANLVYYTFLGSRKVERQVRLIECVERCTNMCEGIAAVFVSLLRGIAQDVELYIEQLLKLKPFLCLLNVT